MSKQSSLKVFLSDLCTSLDMAFIAFCNSLSGELASSSLKYKCVLPPSYYCRDVQVGWGSRSWSSLNSFSSTSMSIAGSTFQVPQAVACGIVNIHSMLHFYDYACMCENKCVFIVLLASLCMWHWFSSKIRGCSKIFMCTKFPVFALRCFTTTFVL